MLAVVMMMVMVPYVAVKSSAMSLSQLQAKFPHGRYWNHLASTYDETGDMLIYYGNSGFADTTTASPCYSHTITDTGSYVGHHDCNFFQLGTRSGIQCMGFALKLANDAYGGYPYVDIADTTDINTAVSMVKPGDVIHYYGYDADWSNGHWVFVMGVSGSTIQVGECNYIDLCSIKWGRSIDIYSLPSLELYSAPSALTTDHVHSYTTYVYDWAAHPHYSCYKCSCGEVKEDITKPNYVASCAECVIPVAPNFYFEAVSESIHVWWNETANSDWYDVYFFDASTGENVNAIYNIKGTECTADMAPGTYTVKVAAVNSNGNYTYGTTSLSSVTVTDINALSGLAPVMIYETEESIYELYSYVTDWETARLWCEQQGGYLMCVNSADEEAILEKIGCYMNGYCWIGATDRDGEGVWTWCDSTIMEYSNWGPSQPDNSTENEDYLMFNNEIKKWNDAPSNTSKMAHFILEKEIFYNDFNVNENGVLVDYIGSGGDVIIPVGVTSIGAQAFALNNNITSVTIPEGVTEIGEGAFVFCKSLANVELPSTLTTIGDGAFAFCYSLTDIEIPEGLTSIGIGAFDCCVSLGDVILPDGVATIGEDAFEGCTMLTLRSYETASAVVDYAAVNDVNFRLILCGDVDDNGAVNSADATLLGRNLAGSSVSTKYGADYNRDGVVNSADITLLRRRLAGADI